MDKQKVILFIVILLFTMLLSCNKTSRQTDKILIKSKDLVEQFPDSTLLLLDSIRNPYELNKEQFAEYYLLQLQAKDKTYKNISDDTLIFQLKNYKSINDNPNKKALVLFYCGRVLQSQGKNENAIQMYLEAETMAKNAKDPYLDGLINFFIGELNYNQHLIDEAILHFKKAEMGFSKIDNKYSNQIISYNYIGNCFLLKEISDSAFHYYDKGLVLAVLHNDSTQQGGIKQNMGVAYLKLGKNEQAKNVLKEALQSSANDIQRAKIYLNLAKIFYTESQKDSALYYSNLSLGLAREDLNLLASNYKLLSQIEEKSGSLSKSLEYSHQYTKNLSLVLKEKEDFSILEVQKKYNFELIEAAKNSLLIRIQWMIISFIIVLSIVIFLFYRHRSRNIFALLNAEQQIYELKEMIRKKSNNDNNNDKDKKLRETLFKQLDIVKKTSLIEGYMKEEEKKQGKVSVKKINEIMCGQCDDFDWNIFYQPVDALYDNYLIRLKSLFPQLNETEILICCLSKIGFNNKEISLLIKSKSNSDNMSKLTENVIQKKKSNIRHKIGMNEQESFIRQLNEIVEKSAINNS